MRPSTEVLIVSLLPVVLGAGMVVGRGCANSSSVPAVPSTSTVVTTAATDDVAPVTSEPRIASAAPPPAPAAPADETTITAAQVPREIDAGFTYTPAAPAPSVETVPTFDSGAEASVFENGGEAFDAAQPARESVAYVLPIDPTPFLTGVDDGGGPNADGGLFDAQ